MIMQDVWFQQIVFQKAKNYIFVAAGDSEDVKYVATKQAGHPFALLTASSFPCFFF